MFSAAPSAFCMADVSLLKSSSEEFTIARRPVIPCLPASILASLAFSAAPVPYMLVIRVSIFSMYSPSEISPSSSPSLIVCKFSPNSFALRFPPANPFLKFFMMSMNESIFPLSSVKLTPSVCIAAAISFVGLVIFDNIFFMALPDIPAFIP